MKISMFAAGRMTKVCMASYLYISDMVSVSDTGRYTA